MNFKINKKEFYDSLAIAARAISSFSPLPSFSGIKIEAFKDYLILTGSDSDISIQTTIEKNDDNLLDISDMGSIVIEAKYILEVVRKIDTDELQFELIDGSSTKISGKSAEFKINGMKSSEYPNIDFSKPSKVFPIEKEQLKNLILKTSFATSDKETKPVLTGVNFAYENNELTLIATDSYRLARRKEKMKSDLSFNITIPAKSLQEVVKTLESNTEVEVAISDKKAQFIMDQTIIQTRLIDGVYPETSRLIPNHFDFVWEIGTHELLSAIDRASFIKNDGISIIKFSLSEKECIISSRAIEVGSSTEVLNSGEFKGEPLEINCNGKYVFEAIRAIGGDMVTFSLSGEMKPFVITSNEDENILQLVLPVRTYA